MDYFPEKRSNLLRHDLGIEVLRNSGIKEKD
jgi:hypothetical protein